MENGINASNFWPPDNSVVKIPHILNLSEYGNEVCQLFELWEAIEVIYIRTYAQAISFHIRVVTSIKTENTRL